jgi:predicted DNA-binding helix-hairpin-helix protein
MWPKLPDHQSHLDDFSCGTGTSASIGIKHEYAIADGRCVSSKMFERMSYRG